MQISILKIRRLLIRGEDIVFIPRWRGCLGESPVLFIPAQLNDPLDGASCLQKTYIFVADIFDVSQLRFGVLVCNLSHIMHIAHYVIV